MRLATGVVLGGVALFYIVIIWIFVWVYRKQRGSVRRSVLVLLVLFTLDGLIVGQGVFAFLVGAFGVLVQLVLSAWRAFRRDGRRSLAHLGAAGVYLATIVVVLGYIGLNNRLAEPRAREVIAACRSYEARQGRLPSSLADLVPDFLPSVPRAKYTLMFGEFRYAVVKSYADPQATEPPPPPHHMLEYVVVPPFGRRLYSFESDSWSYLD